jgi:hypothetical protein
MWINELVAGEGASTPHFAAARVSINSVIFCPVPGAAMGLTPALADEIYRMALELAIRATSPSLYEQAQHVCEN